MKQETIIAIIAVCAGAPASITTAVSLWNRMVLSALKQDVEQVKTNVNGNLMRLKNELAIITNQYQHLTQISSQAQGIAEEKERGRIAGDAKYLEGVQAERDRQRLIQDTKQANQPAADAAGETPRSTL
jgi:hypothetical protein